MVYHIKLTLESKEEHQVHEMCNTAFKQLTEQGLNIVGLQIAQSNNPTSEDELLLEKGLKDQEALSNEGNTSTQAFQTVPASQVQPLEPNNPDHPSNKQGWSTKPSSVTDDGKNKTWDFGTKWI